MREATDRPHVRAFRETMHELCLNMASCFLEGRELRKAYDKSQDMLAAVIRLNMRDKDGELKYAAQKYEPGNNINGLKLTKGATATHRKGGWFC